MYLRNRGEVEVEGGGLYRAVKVELNGEKRKMKL